MRWEYLGSNPSTGTGVSNAEIMRLSPLSLLLQAGFPSFPAGQAAPHPHHQLLKGIIMVEGNKARASVTDAADALNHSWSVTKNTSLRLAEAESGLDQARFQIEHVGRCVSE